MCIVHYQINQEIPCSFFHCSTLIDDCILPNNFLSLNFSWNWFEHEFSLISFDSTFDLVDKEEVDLEALKSHHRASSDHVFVSKYFFKEMLSNLSREHVLFLLLCNIKLIKGEKVKELVSIIFRSFVLNKYLVHQIKISYVHFTEGNSLEKEIEDADEFVNALFMSKILICDYILFLLFLVRFDYLYC